MQIFSPPLLACLPFCDIPASGVVTHSIPLHLCHSSVAILFHAVTPLARSFSLFCCNIFHSFSLLSCFLYASCITLPPHSPYLPLPMPPTTWLCATLTICLTFLLHITVSREGGRGRTAGNYQAVGVFMGSVSAVSPASLDGGREASST